SIPEQLRQEVRLQERLTAGDGDAVRPTGGVEDAGGMRENFAWSDGILDFDDRVVAGMHEKALGALEAAGRVAIAAAQMAAGQAQEEVPSAREQAFALKRREDLRKVALGHAGPCSTGPSRRGGHSQRQLDVHHVRPGRAAAEEIAQPIEETVRIV